jgi:ferredoxin
MCEFCVQHGEGKKWYLTMENYSRELLEQNGRREYAAEFLNTFAATVPSALDQLDLLSRTPLRDAAKPFLTARQKRDHYGQVIPIEEVEQIIRRMEKVVRLPCVCRRVTTGNNNARYCYGLTVDPQLADELDDSFSLEYLSSDEAITSIRKLDKEGLIHSVWTFKTPFIGGICNCDQDCVAYRICHARGHFNVMFRGEWIAEVNNDACNGCKNCMRQCNYGAIRYSSMNKKVEIDPRACYGCGVCRAACHHEAIMLHARSEDAVAKNIW